MSGICVALSKATAQIVGECSYLQAVHLGDEYMVHQALPESTSGHVLRLRHVCWLDIHASFYVCHSVTSLAELHTLQSNLQ